MRSGQISDKQASSGLRLTIDQIGLFIGLFEDDRELAPEALSMGRELHYALHDCFYLVLAIRRGAPFVTADRRLVNRLASTQYKSHVVHLADWT